MTQQHSREKIEAHRDYWERKLNDRRAMHNRHASAVKTLFSIFSPTIAAIEKNEIDEIKQLEDRVEYLNDLLRE